MKRILSLLALLACSSLTNAAEPSWQKIDGGTKTYVDQASIERRDSLLVARVLTNAADEQSLPSGIKYRSSITQRAFKCDSMQGVTVSFELFAEPDGKGNSVGKGVNEQADTGWREAKPGTEGRALLDFVCSYASDLLGKALTSWCPAGVPRIYVDKDANIELNGQPVIRTELSKILSALDPKPAYACYAHGLLVGNPVPNGLYALQTLMALEIEVVLYTDNSFKTLQPKD